MELAASDPDFDTELKRAFSYKKTYGYRNDAEIAEENRRESQNQKMRCERLGELSLRSLRDVRVPKISPRYKSAESVVPSYLKAFETVCASCHNTSGTAICTPIPFQSPLEMKAWVNANPQHVDRIKQRLLSADETYRMPPTTRLTNKELSQILRYLERP